MSVAPRRGAPSIFTLGAKPDALPAAPTAPPAPGEATSPGVASVEVANPFGSLPGGGQPAGVAESGATAMPTLLAPFASGAGLLAAFVAAEALALPLVLRER